MVHHQRHGVRLEQRDGTKIRILKCKNILLHFFNNSLLKVRKPKYIILKSRVSRTAQTHTAIVAGRALTMDSKPERSAGRLEKSTL